MLSIGDKAPTFALKDQEGKTHRLSDYNGKKVALYFYPKDDTPGCTTQGCNIRDNLSALKGKGIVVLGVSKDSIESHKKFSEKLGFNFPILSDENGEVLEKYGVWKQKSIYGKTFLGVQRTTFLIDGKGKILEIIAKPEVGRHADEIIDGFAEVIAKPKKVKHKEKFFKPLKPACFGALRPKGFKRVHAFIWRKGGLKWPSTRSSTTRKSASAAARALQ